MTEILSYNLLLNFIKSLQLSDAKFFTSKIADFFRHWFICTVVPKNWWHGGIAVSEFLKWFSVSNIFCCRFSFYKLIQEIKQFSNIFFLYSLYHCFFFSFWIILFYFYAYKMQPKNIYKISTQLQLYNYVPSIHHINCKKKNGHINTNFNASLLLLL